MLVLCYVMQCCDAMEGNGAELDYPMQAEYGSRSSSVVAKWRKSQQNGRCAEAEVKK
jgi:hypothetical protein